jgi:Fe-S-cluster containining protein
MDFLEHLAPERLALEIRGSRFACSRCGACCTPLRVEPGTKKDEAALKVWGKELQIPESVGTGEHVYHTNRLILDGTEVKRISRATGKKWFDIVKPAPTSEYKNDGTATSLMWVFRYRDEQPRLGDCIFYDFDRGACNIYEDRPSGCQAFPFMFEFEGNEVQTTCDCKNGDFADMSERDALQFAGSVLVWYRTYYGVLDRFEKERAENGSGKNSVKPGVALNRFKRRQERGYAIYEVWDSDGLHRVREKVDGKRSSGFRFA